MNLVRSILGDLVEKRLWPVAAILVALVVAVPMTLAKPGDPPPVAAMPNLGTGDEPGPQLALSRSSLTGFARAPRVSDKRLDPFANRNTKKYQKALDAMTKTANSVIDGSGGSGGGVSDGGSLPTPVTPSDPGTNPGSDPEPTTPAVETEQDDLLSVLVTDGDGEPSQIADIRTLSPLPNPENPFLVYVGKASGSKATFLVSSDVTVDPAGQGTCAPSPQDCRTLTMAIGDTAKFTVAPDNRKISVTVIDIETKDVPVTGDEPTATAARLESEARTVGAKALKSVLGDDQVVASLVKNKVKIRH